MRVLASAADCMAFFFNKKAKSPQELVRGCRELCGALRTAKSQAVRCCALLVLLLVLLLLLQ